MTSSSVATLTIAEISSRLTLTWFERDDISLCIRSRIHTNGKAMKIIALMITDAGNASERQ